MADPDVLAAMRAAAAAPSNVALRLH